MTTPAKPEPTPWTDAREGKAGFGQVDDADVVYSDDCRTLERHLRRIVEHSDEVLKSYILELQVRGHPCPQNMVICSELRNAIQAAKETLSK